MLDSFLKLRERDTMRQFLNLSNEELLTKTKQAALEERKLTLEVLQLLREVEKRRLHLELGYGSIFDYAVKELGYDDAAGIS